MLDRAVVSLELVDPRFYHLDTAIAVLDDGNGTAPADIAYFPGAFSPHSCRTLRDLFPDAIIVSEKEARMLALNAVSDGHHVILPSAAAGFAKQLSAADIRRSRSISANSSSPAAASSAARWRCTPRPI